MAIGGAALAIAAAGGGPTPPPKPLAAAIHDALAAPAPQGVTARVKFTNRLVDSVDIRGSNPLLTGAKKPVNAETWGGPDYHLNYMRWWLGHLPKAAGRTDGFSNNWWQYIANYDEAVRRLPPPGGRLQPANNAMR